MGRRVQNVYLCTELMGVRYEVLCELSSILFPFFRNGIRHEFLLQKQVPGVGDRKVIVEVSRGYPQA